MARTVESDPQTRILDAAENAIAERGYASASLRHIVVEAKVNLATVYYYFHSKRGLLEAVLKRRFGPLRKEHLARLQRVEAATRGRRLPVEKIMEAMLLPPLRLAATAPSQRDSVTRLVGRIVGEPNLEIQDVLRTQRAELRAALLNALRRSLPGASVPDLLWGVEFVWGALAFTLCNLRQIEAGTRGTSELVQTERLLAEMIRFFSAGFRALARGEAKG